MSAVLRPRGGLEPMRASDLREVRAIEQQAYSHPWSEGNFVDSLAAGYIAERLRDEQGELIGYFVAMPGVDELHLLNLTVAPEWQRRGHGAALLEAVIVRAQARHDTALWLEVRQSNHRALALYRRRGFVELGRRRGYYPAVHGREDAVVMRLALDGDALGDPPHGLD